MNTNNSTKHICGIIGAFNTGKNQTTVNEIVLNQFEDQKERGTEGFGLIKISEDMKYQVDRATEGFKFMYDIHKDPVKALICHHRIPTSTPNKLKQTHPILVEHSSLKYKYFVIHNGMISNDYLLKDEHEALGFKYTTLQKDEKFNDSESLAIEVARFIEEQIEEIGALGSAAFICAQVDKKTDKIKQIFFGRNEGNPLNMSKTKEKLLLSSTGQGQEITPFKLYSFKINKELILNKRKMPFKKPIFYKTENSPVNKITQNATKYSQPNLNYTTNKSKNFYDDYDDYGKRYFTRTDDNTLEEMIDELLDNVNNEIEMFVDALCTPEHIDKVTEDDVEEVSQRIDIYLKDFKDSAKERLQEKLQKEAANNTIGYV